MEQYIGNNKVDKIKERNSYYEIIFILKQGSQMYSF